MFRRHSRADMAGVSLENLLASKPRFPMAARLIESWNGLTESDVIAKDTVFIILFTCVDEYFVCKDSQNHRFVIGAECPEPFAETGIDTATPVTQWSQHYQSEALRSPGATAAALKQISLPALVVLRDDPFRGRTPHLHDFILVERLMRQHVAICQTMTTAGQRRVVAVPLNSAMQFKALNLPIQSSLPWHTEAEMRAYGQVYHRLGVPVHRATQSTFEEQVCVHDRFKRCCDDAAAPPQTPPRPSHGRHTKEKKSHVRRHVSAPPAASPSPRESIVFSDSNADVLAQKTALLNMGISSNDFGGSSRGRAGIHVSPSPPVTADPTYPVDDVLTQQTTLHNMGITSQMFGRTSNALSGKRSGAASVSPNPSFHQSAYDRGFTSVPNSRPHSRERSHASQDGNIYRSKSYSALSHDDPPPIPSRPSLHGSASSSLADLDIPEPPSRPSLHDSCEAIPEELPPHPPSRPSLSGSSGSANMDLLRRTAALAHQLSAEPDEYVPEVPSRPSLSRPRSMDLVAYPEEDETVYYGFVE